MGKKPKETVERRNGVTIRRKAPPEEYRVAVRQGFELHSQILYQTGTSFIVPLDSGRKVPVDTKLRLVFDDVVMPVGAIYVDHDKNIGLTRNEIESLLEKGYLKKVR